MPGDQTNDVSKTLCSCILTHVFVKKTITYIENCLIVITLYA